MKILKTVEHSEPGQSSWEPESSVCVGRHGVEQHVNKQHQGRLQTHWETIGLSIDSDTCIRIQRATLDLISWPAARLISKLNVSSCQPEQSMLLCIWTYQLCLLLVKCMLSSL